MQVKGGKFQAISYVGGSEEDSGCKATYVNLLWDAHVSKAISTNRKSARTAESLIINHRYR